MELLMKAERMIMKYPLCDNCLGRQFALLGSDLSNGERGEALKTLLAMKAHMLIYERKDEDYGLSLLKALAINGDSKVAKAVLRRLGKEVEESRDCYLCGGRFKLIDDIVEAILKKVEGFEFNTFLVGVKLPNEVEERDDEFKAEFEVKFSENIRNELSREIGKRISKILGRRVDYKSPEMVILINPFKETVTLKPNPLFIYGRYRKLKRGLPQSRWVCRECKGKGCPRCDWTGKLYPESVEELISKKVLEATLGKKAKLHAAGREDRDVLMLGNGRPFVLEIKEPKKRFIDLENLSKEINEYAKGKVEVLDLQFSDRETVRRIKKFERSQKVYRVVAKFDREISDEDLRKVEEALNGVRITQRTPTRVLHRRADKVREKQIYEVKVRKLKPNKVEMIIRSEGGLYIKELINGDGGRTKPNVAEVVGREVKIEKLDVLNVIEG